MVSELLNVNSTFVLPSIYIHNLTVAEKGQPMRQAAHRPHGQWPRGQPCGSIVHLIGVKYFNKGQGIHTGTMHMHKHASAFYTVHAILG